MKKLKEETKVGRKGFAPLLLVILVIVAILVSVYAVLAYFGEEITMPNIPGVTKSGSDVVSVTLYDKDGNPVSQKLSIVGTTEGVYFISFEVKATNSGQITFSSMTVQPKTNTGTDFSGDLYNALKNKQTTPAQASNIASGLFGDWNTKTSCVTTADCDTTEQCAASGFCLIPTSGYENNCAAGCNFGSTIQGNWTYAATQQSLAKSGTLNLIIKPDPVAGFDVTVLQH